MSRKYDLHRFEFSRRWFFNRNYQTFVDYVMPVWRDKPFTYLEIGVFEGQSLCWMNNYVLTHPDSRSIGIDPWLMTTKLNSVTMEDVMYRAKFNVRRFPGKVELVQGASAEVLRKMNAKGHAGITKDSVDLCMIDGNHWAPYVVDDAVQCLSLVKVGGWLMFDDVENDIEKKDHVKQGLAMFLEGFGDRVKEIWRHRYMVCLERIR